MDNKPITVLDMFGINKQRLEDIEELMVESLEKAYPHDYAMAMMELAETNKLTRREIVYVGFALSTLMRELGVYHD